MAEEFIETEEAKGLAVRTKAKTQWLYTLIEPDLGNRPMTDIKPFEVLPALKKIELRGNHETSMRLRAFASRVFRYAIVTGRAHFNPAAELAVTLVSPKVTHHAAILESAKVGALMQAIDALDGFVTTRLALQIAPHVFVRPSELRHAEWSDFDFEEAVWRIPAANMKMRSPHMVPLFAAIACDFGGTSPLLVIRNSCFHRSARLYGPCWKTPSMLPCAAWDIGTTK